MHPSQGAGLPVAPVGMEMSARNAPISDEELDAILPGEDQGYKVLEPPPGYAPVRAPAHKLMQTPVQTGGFMMQDPNSARMAGHQLPKEIPGVGDLQFFKPEDMQYFSKLTETVDEEHLSVEELKERKIMRLLLKIKNASVPARCSTKSCRSSWSGRSRTRNATCW